MAERISEDAFIERYGETPIQIGRFTLSLNIALRMERDKCPVDQNKRSDPEARLGYMSRLVGTENLDQAHWDLTLLHADQEKTI